MAKLDVVIPAVEVEVNGVKYRKVDRKAQAGDIIRIMECSRSYVTFGGFYTVDRVDGWGDARITDDDGNSYDTYGDKYDVYEKVASSATKYSEVKRKANIGERIRIVDRDICEEDYEDGAEFVVSRVDSDGDVYVTCGDDDDKMVCYEEYVVLEPVEKSGPSQPKPKVNVGDKIRITRYQCNWTEGTVVTITNPDVGGVVKTARAKSEDGRSYLTDYDSFEVLTAEELAQIAEEAKWTAIGRRVNEFKAGDIVEATCRLGKRERILGKFTGGVDGPAMGLITPAGGYYSVDVDGAKLIVPVEQRFDTKEAA